MSLLNLYNGNQNCVKRFIRFIMSYISQNQSYLSIISYLQTVMQQKPMSVLASWIRKRDAAWETG